ncbi:hypothetical protein LTS18_006527 [Coniosporium uncinatum]|uniref:Uncharacterized protein n=1 Tax=Coniosporium uncinatum TaxID=93489 RepID=A0ACC3DQE1_9PEZI|nr:hypothetical protein LTS18_006527 [Coniosporium uncinatum]
MAVSPTRKPEREFAIQKYQLLSSQQDQLRQRLSFNTHDAPSSSISAQPATFGSVPISIPGSVPRSPPSPLSPGFSSSIEDREDDARLYQVNKQIKSTLTDLLNNESVKHDDKFRSWVQRQLMEAEMEMKRQKRRRSSADKHELCDTISHSFSRSMAHNTSFDHAMGSRRYRMSM